MSLSAELTTAQRRWLAALTVAGLLLTGAALALQRTPRGVYWSRVTMTLLVPRSTEAPNVIKTRTGSLVRAAGAVARIVDPSGGKLRLADDDVTLASEGIVHGTAVTLPNAGGQWTYSFAQPLLQVEAVGTTPDEVQSRMSSAIARIRSALAGLQPAGRVDAQNMIGLLQTPRGTPPTYFQAANRPRALAMTLVLGLLMTFIARAAFRAWALRRGRADAAADGTREPAVAALVG